MSRLQKKCFIGATGFHLLLLALLVVGPAFMSLSEADPTPVLEFIPRIVTDEKVSGGGTPRPSTPTPIPPSPQPQLQQPQPQPQVQPPTPRPPRQRDPDPPKVEQVKETRTEKRDPDAIEPKPDKKKHEVKISDTLVKVPRDSKSTIKPATDTAAAAAAATARANAQRQRQFAAALKNISSGLTPSTKIEMLDGPGGGGVSYANYGEEVKRIYTEAWRIPTDVTDDEATVRVSVTIARDGHVISSRIIQNSGSKLVDNSIQSTLDRVTFVRAFPDGSKDSQKTFNISFSLKAKKLG